LFECECVLPTCTIHIENNRETHENKGSLYNKQYIHTVHTQISVLIHTNDNQPKMKPSAESAAGAIGAPSSARVPDLKPLELGRLPEEEVEAEEPPVDVAVGMSDDGTAEMGAGDWPP
jgi:hypothetical protein